MKIAILRNEDPESANKWLLACKKLEIPVDVINLTSHDWLERIGQYKYNFFILKPPGQLSHYKTLYDERLYILTKVLGKKTYPSYEECNIYENKRMLSYFLDANDIPHPKTHVFYDKTEAINFFKKNDYPIVAKTSIGASGSGVTIIKNTKQAIKYINKAFSAKGIKRRFGPNRVTGTVKKWVTKAVKSPTYLIKKIKEYFAIYRHGERDYVIFQKYIPHNFEWRSIRIGDSYFAHKKIKQGEKASGSKEIDYVNPPVSLLNFTKDLCDKYNFNFMAIDLFEDDTNGYVVNELQTIFGHVQDSVLLVDGKSGRYIFNDNWVFEKGEFNTNESYDLRLQVALNLYEKDQ